MRKIILLLLIGMISLLHNTAIPSILPVLSSIYLADNIVPQHKIDDIHKLQDALVKQFNLELPYNSFRSNLDKKAEQIEKSIMKNFISLVNNYTPFSTQYTITTISASYIILVRKMYTQSFCSNTIPNTRYSMSFGQDLISLGMVITF